MSIAQALDEVRARIERAARASGRNPDDVLLVAVSKTQPESAVREAYAAGQRAFGENYAQELATKAEALADLPDLVWHFIGHLQTNKAKVVAAHAHVVHTIDSTALARELGRRTARLRNAEEPPLSVFIEVNVGGEPQKAGVTGGDLAEVIASIQEQPMLALRGLMVVPPAGDLETARRVFGTLASLRNLHGGPRVLPDLSMGMTADLEVAIACGATVVRVGTGVFGARNPEHR